MSFDTQRFGEFLDAMVATRQQHTLAVQTAAELLYMEAVAGQRLEQSLRDLAYAMAAPPASARQPQPLQSGPAPMEHVAAGPRQDGHAVPAGPGASAHAPTALRQYNISELLHAATQDDPRRQGPAPQRPAQAAHSHKGGGGW